MLCFKVLISAQFSSNLALIIIVVVVVVVFIGMKHIYMFITIIIT